MSVQWTLVAGFLYAEVALVLLLVLPVASPKRWNAIFKSKFLEAIQRQAGIYFLIVLGILILLLLDAFREMRKYSSIDVEEHGGHSHLDKEMQGSMRLFRAQRNFYISGFSLFLILVIRRLVILITTQAALLAQSEASMRQAQSASAAAKSLLNETAASKKNDSEKALEAEITELKEKIAKLKEQLTFEIKDKEAIKSQADNLAKEYDRLAEESSKLQKKILIGGGEKKDE